MSYKNKMSTDNEKSILGKIKSKYILKEVFELLHLRIQLKLIKYNHKLKKKLEIKFNDYIDFSYSIEIEIIPKANHATPIYVPPKDLKDLITIKDDNSKIQLIISPKATSLLKLFEECNEIEGVIFKKFLKILNL